MVQVLANKYRYNEVFNTPAWVINDITPGTALINNNNSYAHEGSLSFGAYTTNNQLFTIAMDEADKIQCVPGDMIEFSGYVRGNGRVVTPAVFFYDNNDDLLTPEPMESETSANSDWTFFTDSVVAPLDASTFIVVIVIDSNSSGHFYYIDNLSVDLIVNPFAKYTTGFFNLMPPVPIR